MTSSDTYAAGKAIADKLAPGLEKALSAMNTALGVFEAEENADG